MMEDSRSMAKLKRQLMNNGAGEEYSNKKVDLLNNRQYLKVGKKCHEFRSQNDSLMPQDHYIFFMIYEVNQFHCPSRGNKHGIRIGQWNINRIMSVTSDEILCQVI